MSTPPPVVVADRYRLVAPLGQGGMGRVWRATDVVLHRDVAIKELVPPPGLTPEERQEMRERSLREARAIARLNNINVVRIFDVLRTDGDPWIVMEYVPSRSLQDTLASDGPFGAVRAAEIGLGVLNALRAAHRNGVVHRDVKPGNVLIGAEGRVVLTDFGLATVPGDPNVTRTGLVLGSPAYIAPERARDGTAGPAADLWSLGATLYAAVEGSSPFARPSAIATLAALATENPPPARNAGPLKPVLNGLLRKDPTHRINAEEAERLLLRASGRRSKVAFSMNPTMRRPGAGRERPALAGPPPVVPGRPAAGSASVPGIPRAGSASVPGASSPSSSPVVPGPRPPVIPGRPSSGSGANPPPVIPGRPGEGRAPVFTPGKATVGRAPRPPERNDRTKVQNLDATRVDAAPARDNQTQAPNQDQSSTGTKPTQQRGGTGASAPPAGPVHGALARGSRGVFGAITPGGAAQRDRAADRPDADRPDADRPDAGRSDAGRSDAGRSDAGRSAAGRSAADRSGAEGPVGAQASNQPVVESPVRTRVAGQAGVPRPAAERPDVEKANAEREATARATAQPEAADQVTAQREAADQVTAQREAAELATAQREAAAEREAADRAAAERAEAERLAREHAAAQRAAEERAAAEAAAAQNAAAQREALERAAAEWTAREKHAADKVAAQKAAAERAAAERAAEEKATAERAATERAEAEKAAAEKAAAEKAAAERAAAEKTAAEGAANEKAAAERAAAEKAAAEQVAVEKAAAERAAQDAAAEQAAPEQGTTEKTAEGAAEAQAAAESEATATVPDEPVAEKAQETGSDQAEPESAEPENAEPENAETERAEDEKAEQEQDSGAKDESSKAESNEPENTEPDEPEAPRSEMKTGAPDVEKGEAGPEGEAADKANEAGHGGAAADKTSVVAGGALANVPAFGGPARPAWTPMELRPRTSPMGLTVFGTTLTRRQTVIAGAIVLALVLIVLVVIVPKAFGDSNGTAGKQAPNQAGTVPARSAQPPSSPATKAATEPPSAAPSTTAPRTGVNLPAGWFLYRDPTGFSVPVPKDWSIRRQGTEVYFQENGGQYRLLIVDQTNHPKPDPRADWQNQESQRVAGYRNYHRIGITTASYWDKAADWEFTRTSDNGNPLHVVKRGFITAPDLAYGITWSTSAGDWNANKANLDLIYRGFVPARN